MNFSEGSTEAFDTLRNVYPESYFISVEYSMDAEILKVLSIEQATFIVYHLGKQLKTFKESDVEALRTYLDSLPKIAKLNQPDLRIITKDYDRLLDEIKNQYYKLRKANLPVFYIEEAKLASYIT